MLIFNSLVVKNRYFSTFLNQEKVIIQVMAAGKYLVQSLKRYQ